MQTTLIQRNKKPGVSNTHTLKTIEKINNTILPHRKEKTVKSKKKNIRYKYTLLRKKLRQEKNFVNYGSASHRTKKITRKKQFFN